jgi:hypothetical protein
LLPSFDSGEDAGGVGIGFLDEAVDGGLQIELLPKSEAIPDLRPTVLTIPCRYLGKSSTDTFGGLILPL